MIRPLAGVLIALLAACGEAGQPPVYVYEARCGATVTPFYATQITTNTETHGPHIAYRDSAWIRVVVARFPSTCSVVRVNEVKP